MKKLITKKLPKSNGNIVWHTVYPNVTTANTSHVKYVPNTNSVEVVLHGYSSERLDPMLTKKLHQSTLKELLNYRDVILIYDQSVTSKKDSKVRKVGIEIHIALQEGDYINDMIADCIVHVLRSVILTNGDAYNLSTTREDVEKGS